MAFFGRLWSNYQGWVQRSPLLAKPITTGVIMIGGDALAQGMEMSASAEKRDEGWNFARSGRIGLFGTVALGPTLHVWYSGLNRLIPKSDVVSVVGKTVLDQIVLAPVILFGFFAGLGAMEGQSREAIEEKCKNAFWPTLKANWMIWPAAQVVNFKLVPAHLQPLYVNCIAFGWNTYLSLANSKANAAAKLAKE